MNSINITLDNLTQQELKKEIIDAVNNIELGLKVMDTNLLIEDQVLDILAVDVVGRVTIIELDMERKDILLLEALDHFEWVFNNMESLGRKYQKENIDYTLAPRIILIAPDFTPHFIKRISFITKVKINLYQYHYQEKDGIKKILFKPVGFIQDVNKLMEINKKSLEDYLNLIKNQEMKRLCHQAISIFKNFFKNFKIDTSRGYIAFLFNHKELGGVYPQTDSFWINFYTDKWRGVKISNKSEFIFTMEKARRILMKNKVESRK